MSMLTLMCKNVLASQWLVSSVSIKMLYYDTHSRLDELNINSGWPGTLNEYSFTASTAPRISPDILFSISFLNLDSCSIWRDSLLICNHHPIYLFSNFDFKIPLLIILSFIRKKNRNVEALSLTHRLYLLKKVHTESVS